MPCSVLRALWSCPDRLARPLEILRSSPGFWEGLGACLPDADSLSEDIAAEDVADQEPLTWRLQVNANALAILLAELCASPRGTQGGNDD